MDPRTIRKLRKLIAPINRIGLKKREFTIFSNNCWGGRLYDKFALPYQSPTIGLSMSPEDYLKFLGNMDYYLALTPTPIFERQKTINDECGIYDCYLGDIIICFRHYRNVDDAISKWNRRKLRIVKNNILVKFSYYPGESYDERLIQQFNSLPYKKIIFTNCKKITENVTDARIVLLPCKNEQDNEFVLSDKVFKLKEIKRIINS